MLLRIMLGLKYKHWYLLLTIIGFLAPNVFVTMESAATGNVLLWAKPIDTLEALFAKNIPAAYATELILVIITFFVWSYKSAKKYKIRITPFLWLLTLALGLSGTFPLFLYLRELKREKMLITG
ncbi:MAG: DUF2834 domain-containing protein [Bacteroidia bacterium]